MQGNSKDRLLRQLISSTEAQAEITLLARDRRSTRTREIIATDAAGNIPQTIADFVNQSADFARKLITLKEHPILSSNKTREQKEMLPVKLITCRFPVMIQPMIVGQRRQMTVEVCSGGRLLSGHNWL